MSTFDYILAVTDQTSGTVTLTTNPFQVKEWQVRTGADEDATVTEAVEIRLTDGAVAANLEESRTLQKLLQQAKDAQRNRAIDKVYVTWQQASGGTIYRSEIMDGRLEWEAEALQYPQWYGDTQFARVHWERGNWWEGPEAQLGLSNPHGTVTTAAGTVYNHNNGGTCNYLDIAGTAVLGDIPGATRLEMTNSYYSAVSGLYGTVVYGLDHVWIGQNVFTPSSFDHIIEGEAADYGGTVVALANGSGGSAIQTGAVQATETLIFSWALPTAVADAANGRLHRLTFKSDSMESANIFRFRLKLVFGTAAAGVALWQSDLVSPDSSFVLSTRNLFTLKLPPWPPGLSGATGLYLQLWGLATIAEPGLLNIDFIQLTPADGYRELKTASYDVPYEYRIIDDGIGEYLYVDDGAGADKAGIMTGYGAPIRVWPARDQRLYFLMNPEEIDRTLSVKVFYRPRRRSL